MDFSEKWGSTVEEAVNLALVDLKLTRDEVNVTVLEEPSKGFFGIGSKLAKVRVERKPEPVKEELKKPEPVKVEPKQEKKAESPEKPERVERQERSERTERSERNDRPERRDRPARKPQERDNRKSGKPQHGKRRDFAAMEEEVQEKSKRLIIRERPDDLVEFEEGEVLDFLRNVSDKMGLTLKVKGFKNDTNIYIEIEGKDSGTIIGKRGATLDAIQYLSSLVANKNQEKYIRVVVDAENYREKRERTLEQLANRLADKVRRTGKSVRLEPMNPYERKVIHATLQGRKDVVTRSEGEEPYRRVIIELK